jgi:winged helix DNA-binding protein
VPDAPLPDPETPAPPRFLLEFDNALLSHADRIRVISDEYRRALFKAPIMRGVLLDGFVCATWKKERTREKATLLIEPFEPLATKERASLAKEGERLVRFVGNVARRSRSGLPSPREATGLRSGGGAG